jgi:hypothetical protein
MQPERRASSVAPSGRKMGGFDLAISRFVDFDVAREHGEEVCGRALLQNRKIAKSAI